MWSDAILIDQLETYVTRKQYAQSYEHLTLVFTALLGHEQELESDQIRRFLSAVHFIVLELGALAKPQGEAVTLDKKIYLKITEFFERLTIVAKRNPAFALEFNEILQAFYLEQGNVYRALARGAYHQPEQGYLDARQKYSTALEAYHKSWRISAAAQQGQAALRISQTIAEIRYSIIREDYRSTYDPHESVRQLTEYGMYQEAEHYDDAFMGFYQHIITTASKQLNLNDDAAPYRALVEIVLPFLDKLENDGKIQAGTAIAGTLYRNGKTTEDEFARHLLARYTHLTNVGQGTEPAVRHEFLLPVSRWESEKARLRALRGRFDDIPTTTYRAIQKQYTQEIVAFLGDKAHRAAQLFQHAPCRYQLVGLGSMAREEMNRFSDADIGMLLEDSEALKSDPDRPDKLVEVKRFFTKWFDLFTLELEALGETEAHSGLFFDDMNKGSLSKVLQGYVNTPQGILTELSPQSLITSQTLFEDHSFYAWYRGVIPIYGGGAQSAQHLVREYRALLWQALREGEKHRAIAERYLTTHLQLFAQKALTDEIDLKERFIRPFTYLYSDLGLYYGIEAYDLEGIVEGLKRSDMDPAFLQAFQSQHQFIHDLRCRVHRYYGEEHDTVSLAEGENPTPGATYHLDPADRKGLAGVHGFLQSMARQIPRLLAQKTTQPFNPITEDFRCLLLADFNAALIEMQKEFTRQINTPQAIDLEAYYRLRLQIEELEKRLIVLHKRSLWTEAKVLLYQQLFDEFKDLRKSLLFKYEARPKERYWIEIPSSKMTQAAALQAKIADWIQQDQAQLAPLVPEDFIHQHPEMIRAQVELLIKQQSSLQAYQALYVLLPFYWQERLIERLPRETYELLRPFLDSHPLPDGTRPGVMRDRVQFEEGLKSLFLPASSMPTTDRSAITLAYATFTQAQEVSGRLKPEIAAQFQSIPERLAAERPRSVTSDRSHNHLVFPIMIDGQSYHIKVFPEFPVFEIAVSLLYDSIIGCCGVSKSVLACVTIAGQDYPILISQTVPGVPLDEYLKIQANPSIDKFSQLALMHLLLPPEDAKKQNFVYHPLLNTIIGIDNDHVFTPPVLERTLRRDQIMIKAVLFCFNQMKRPFSEESIREFLALTPLYVLDLWLKGLHHYALQAKQLFKAENVSTWERAKIPKSTENRYYQNSVVSFQLPSELVNRLYQQMMTIQHLLKQNEHITPYELLGLLAPSISEYYGRLLSLPEASVSERFAHVERELYGPAVQSSQYLTIVKSVGSRLMPIAHPEQSCTIPQSQRELAKVDQQYHLVFGMRARLEQGESAKIIEGLLPYFQVQIMNHLDWSVLSTAQQKALLVRLADPQLNTVMRKLTIRGCQLLTDSLLERILAGKTYLQALHIEFCDELIEMILPDLPQLRRLEVRHCFSLQKIRAPKEGNLIVLNQLKIIALERCRHLTIVDIQFNHEMKDECYSVELGIHQYLIRGHERAERFLSIAIEKWKTDEPRGFRYLEAWYYRGLAALCLGERELALRCFARVMQGHILLLGSCLREGEGNPRLAEQLEQLWTDYKIEIMTKLMTHNEGASSASSSSEPSPQNLMMVLTILQEKQRNRMARIFASLLIDASARQDLTMNAKTYLFARMKEVLIAAAIPAPFPLLFGPDVAPLPEEAVRTLAATMPIPAAINNPADLRHLFRTLNLQTINRQWYQFFSLPMVRERLPAKNPEVMQVMDKFYSRTPHPELPIVSREKQLRLKQKPQPRYSFSELCAAGVPLSRDSIKKYPFVVPGKSYLYKVVCCGSYGEFCTYGLEEATGFKRDVCQSSIIGVDFNDFSFIETATDLKFKFQFWWFSEQERFRSLTSLHARGCNGVLFFQGTSRLEESLDIWWGYERYFRYEINEKPVPIVLVTFSDNANYNKTAIEEFKREARVTHHIQIPYGSTLSSQALCTALTGILGGQFVKPDQGPPARQRTAENVAPLSKQNLAILPPRPAYHSVVCCGGYSELCLHGLVEATGLSRDFYSVASVNYTEVCFEETVADLQFKFGFWWLPEPQEQQEYGKAVSAQILTDCHAVLFFQGGRALDYSLQTWVSQANDHPSLLVIPCILITFSDNTDEEKAAIEKFKRECRVLHHIQIPYGEILSPQALCAVLTGISDGHFVKPDQAPLQKRQMSTRAVSLLREPLRSLLPCRTSYSMVCCGFYSVFCEHTLGKATGLRCDEEYIHGVLKTSFFKDMETDLQFRFTFSWMKGSRERFGFFNNGLESCRAVLFFQGEKNLERSLRVWNDCRSDLMHLIAYCDDNPRLCILVTFSDNTDEEKAAVEKFKHDVHVTHHIQIPYGRILSPQEFCAILTEMSDGRFVTSDQASWKRQCDAEVRALASREKLVIQRQMCYSLVCYGEYGEFCMHGLEEATGLKYNAKAQTFASFTETTADLQFRFTFYWMREQQRTTYEICAEKECKAVLFFQGQKRLENSLSIWNDAVDRRSALPSYGPFDPICIYVLVTFSENTELEKAEIARFVRKIEGQASCCHVNHIQIPSDGALLPQEFCAALTGMLDGHFVKLDQAAWERRCMTAEDASSSGQELAASALQKRR